MLPACFSRTVKVIKILEYILKYTCIDVHIKVIRLLSCIVVCFLNPKLHETIRTILMNRFGGSQAYSQRLRPLSRYWLGRINPVFQEEGFELPVPSQGFKFKFIKFTIILPMAFGTLIWRFICVDTSLSYFLKWSDILKATGRFKYSFR